MKWQDGRYNSSFAQIGMFRATVAWDACLPKDAPEEMRGYRASFEGATLKKRFKDMREAQQAIEELADRELRKAIMALTGAVSINIGF